MKFHNEGKKQHEDQLESYLLYTKPKTLIRPSELPDTNRVILINLSTAITLPDTNRVIAVDKLMSDGLVSISKMKHFAAEILKRKVHLIQLYVKDFDHEGHETLLTDDDAVVYALKEALKHHGSDGNQSFSVFIKTPKWPEFIQLVYVGCDTAGAQSENCEMVGT